MCKTPCAKWEVLKTEKCTWSSRGCICSKVSHKNHLLNVSLKRKTNNISIIIRRMTTEKRARAVGILRQGAGIRQVSIFSENVTNPGLLPTNQTELLIFRSPVISDAGIQRSGAYVDRQRNRYVLLLADQRLLLSLL